MEARESYLDQFSSSTAMEQGLDSGLQASVFTCRTISPVKTFFLDKTAYLESTLYCSYFLKSINHFIYVATMGRERSSGHPNEDVRSIRTVPHGSGIPFPPLPLIHALQIFSSDNLDKSQNSNISISKSKLLGLAWKCLITNSCRKARIFYSILVPICLKQDLISYHPGQPSTSPSSAPTLGRPELAL